MVKRFVILKILVFTSHQNYYHQVFSLCWIFQTRTTVEPYSAWLNYGRFYFYAFPQNDRRLVNSTIYLIRQIMILYKNLQHSWNIFGVFHISNWSSIFPLFLIKFEFSAAWQVNIFLFCLFFCCCMISSFVDFFILFFRGFYFLNF